MASGTEWLKMGYFVITAELEESGHPSAFVLPKSHTPGPQLQQRGHRYYNPELGRWISRDPSEGKGEPSLLLFVKNSSVNDVDSLGLMVLPPGSGWRSSERFAPLLMRLV